MRRADLHRASGQEAARAGISELDCRGRMPTHVRLRKAPPMPGWRRRMCTTWPTASDAADLAVTLVKPGDLVLVKGSRGIRTEVVVDRLKAEFA